MDYEVEGFSETGLLVFGGTMIGLCLLILIAAFLTLIFARRHRFLKACGVFLGGTVLATPALIVATAVAMYI